MKEYDLIIVGGGISGMTAALTAHNENIDKILIIERGEILGGILNQFIHNDFGEEVLDRVVTGPEYVNYLEEKIEKTNIEVKLNSEVLKIEEGNNVEYVSPNEGIAKVHGKAIILASGCREVYTGSIAIATNRFAGIYTIGNAHRIINQEGYMPGNRPFIVVNSKWGLIVARRIVIEGGKIQGLLIETNEDFRFDKEDKNIIEGFNIPVIENKVLTGIFGKERVEGVNIKDINTYEESMLKCDSLILSVGYFPEIYSLEGLNLKINDYTKSVEVNNYQTSNEGLFTCGNVLYGVHAVKEKGLNGIDAAIAASTYIKSLD